MSPVIPKLFVASLRHTARWHDPCPTSMTSMGKVLATNTIAPPVESVSQQQDRLEVSTAVLSPWLKKNSKALSEYKASLIAVQQVAFDALRRAMPQTLTAVFSGCSALVVGSPQVAQFNLIKYNAELTSVLGGITALLMWRSVASWRCYWREKRQANDLRVRILERSISYEQAVLAARQAGLLLRQSSQLSPVQPFGQGSAVKVERKRSSAANRAAAQQTFFSEVTPAAPLSVSRQKLRPETTQSTQSTRLLAEPWQDDSSRDDAAALPQNAKTVHASRQPHAQRSPASSPPSSRD